MKPINDDMLANALYEHEEVGDCRIAFIYAKIDGWTIPMGYVVGEIPWARRIVASLNAHRGIPLRKIDGKKRA